jgi:hypothetical protein
MAAESREGIAEMQRTAETDLERLERQQREREAMRQAVAEYRGPVTKCPPGKTSDPNARPFKGSKWPRLSEFGRF